MMKRLSFELSHGEFLGITGIDRVTFEHERNAPTPTGIRAIVRDFWKDGEIVDESKVFNMIRNGMVENGFIQEPKKWRVSIVPKHDWSAPNEEGNSHSVYTVQVTVFQAESIWIKDENNQILF